MKTEKLQLPPKVKYKDMTPREKDRFNREAQAENDRVFKEQQDARDNYFANKNRLGNNEGGMPVDTYPNIPPDEMAEVEASQLPDDEMEEGYLDYAVDE